MLDFFLLTCAVVTKFCPENKICLLQRYLVFTVTAAKRKIELSKKNFFALFIEF